MAKKYDDNVVWVPLNVDGWDNETKGIYQELRDSWDVSKAIKVRLEARLSAKADKEASTWPTKAKVELDIAKANTDPEVTVPTPYHDMMVALQITPSGKVASTHQRKFSYMRGVAMASVPVSKAKASKGLVI